METRVATEEELMRERTESLRVAALLAYGAMLASNETGRFGVVLGAMEEALFPASDPPVKSGRPR